MNLKDYLPNVISNQSNESCFPTLSYTERLIGFGICFVVGIKKFTIGYLIQLLSFGAFLGVLTGSPAKFAIIYSVGNILSLVGTGFLIGFKKQLHNMVDKDRRYTSIIFMSALVLTILSAVVLQSKLLVLLCLLVQIPAYIWYVASYIPFARSCILNCIKSVFRR